MPHDAALPDAVCASCGVAQTCPPVSAWPRELKRWVVDRLLQTKLAQHGGDCDHAWKHLLAMALRNTTVPQPHGPPLTLSFAASPDDVYAAALRLASEADALRRARAATKQSDAQTDQGMER